MDAKGYKAAMTYTNLKTLLGTPFLLLCSLLLMVRPAYTAPVVLEDKVMEQVTAGNTKKGGGVVIGKSSDTIANSTTGLNLSGEAQQKAKGLNLVNTTGSAIANTVNIWAGNVVSINVENNDIKPVLEVNQINQVTQNQVKTATLSGYLRSESDTTEVNNKFGSENHFIKLTNIKDVVDRSKEIIYTETTSDSLVDTKLILDLDDNLYIEGHLGQGVASSGYVKATFEGGSAEFALGVNASIEASASIGVTGILGTSATLTADASAEAGLAFITRIELPTMELELNGSGCGVILGSCEASGTSKKVVISSTDNSTLDVVENHQSGQSVFSEEHIQVYRSPFELKSAKAEYIIVDDSSLELISDVSLELSDSAQKEIEAMNIVNAINSNVANSTNISRASEFKSSRSTLVLNQFNIVHHGQ